MVFCRAAVWWWCAVLVTCALASVTNVDIGPVTAWLGSATTGASHGTGGAAVKFNSVTSVTVSPTTHDLYLADYFNQVVRKVTPGATFTQDWLGTLGGGFGTSTADGAAATMNHPTRPIITSDGATMYLPDNGNHVIRIVTMATAANSVYVGQMGTSGDTDGKGTGAKLRSPTGIVIAGSDLYVTVYFKVRRVALADAQTSTAAGSTNGYQDGPAAETLFKTPQGIEYRSSTSDLYIADNLNQCIRNMKTDGTTSTIAGNASATGADDGQGTSATFSYPRGVTIDPTNTYLFIAEAKIRRMTLASPYTVVTVIASGGFTSSSVSYLAKVNVPYAVSFSMDAATMYVSTDSGVYSVTVVMTPAPTTSTPVPSTSASTTPVPSTSASTTPVPSTSTSPVPSTSTSTSPTSTTLPFELPPNFTLPANFSGIDAAHRVVVYTYLFVCVCGVAGMIWVSMT